MSLQQRFDAFVRLTPLIPLPNKCINISDAHAAVSLIKKETLPDGTEKVTEYGDPLKESGNEDLLIEILSDYYSKGYILLGSELYDTWRGIDLSRIYYAHPKLIKVFEGYQQTNRRFWVLGNHERDLCSYPEAIPFQKSDGRKLFLCHGWWEDFWNDEGWEVARFFVRYPGQALDLTGVNDATSARPNNPDRHAGVRQRWAELALANPTWDFAYGHTHLHEYCGETFPDTPSNYFNSGCCIQEGVTGYLIEDGHFIPMLWK